MPNNTIFLGGDHLRQFLGYSLTDQAHVLIQSRETKININIASLDQLRISLRSVGSTRARLFISLREKRLFKNWDLKKRFTQMRDKGLPLKNKEFITYK